jgi:hypothetical protein
VFIRNNETVIRMLGREGQDERSIGEFMNSLFQGINSQIYNAPVDLFIESFLFNAYPSLRPFQMVSLMSMLNEYVEIARSRTILKYTPPTVRHASIVLNLVGGLQVKDLFGIDVTRLFRAAPRELNQAKAFFNEYVSYQKDDRAVEAHLLIRNWSTQLGIEKYFTLIEEQAYRGMKPASDTVTDEPEHLMSYEELPPRGTQVDLTGVPTGQAAVTMYCLSAIELFENMDQAKIREIGFEIATLGTKGIDHSNSEEKYVLKSLPGKEFTGLQLLAYIPDPAIRDGDRG